MLIDEITKDVYDVLLHTETEKDEPLSDVVDIDILASDIAKLICNKTLNKYKDDYR